MPSVSFTAHLRRHAPPGPVRVDGATVRAALSAVFVGHPALESYILDDQKRLRRHVALFVDGERARLDSPVAAAAEITVLQALSGG
jgi:hypothetical protein